MSNCKYIIFVSWSLNLEYVKKCRFENGYVYQPVFSCQTCYIEQCEADKKETITQQELSKKVQPHGICLACMLTCHEGHEVHELYSKASFKCDCGNSRLPFGCQLTAEKEYSNDLNRYNTTFFDIYCHCNLTSDQNSTVKYNFMAECMNCEDWYHNTHLLPPILSK